MAHGYALLLPLPKPLLPVENRVRFAVLVVDADVTASGRLERSGTKKAMSKSRKGESRESEEDVSILYFVAVPVVVT